MHSPRVRKELSKSYFRMLIEKLLSIEFIYNIITEHSWIGEYHTYFTDLSVNKLLLCCSIPVLNSAAKGMTWASLLCFKIILYIPRISSQVKNKTLSLFVVG